MALEAGSIFAKLGAILDERGFDRFDRAVDSRRKAKADATLGADVDKRGFDTFDAAVVAAGRAKADADLGAHVDRRAFDEFDVAVRNADKARAEAALGAKIDDAAFKVFTAEVEKADRKTATAKLKADLDTKGFLAFAAMSKSADRDANAVTNALAGMGEQAVAAGGAIGGGSGLTAKAFGLSGALGSMGGLLVAAAPPILALAGAATALAGSLAAAAAGAGAVGIGIAAAAGPLAALAGAVVARVGLMSEAYKALGKEQDKSGATAKANATAQESAAHAIQQAEQGLADARRTGRQQIADAERSLADARRNGDQSVAAAEQSLTEARRSGARSVADAERALADARESSARSIADAEKSLAEVRQAGADRVREAEQRLADTRASGTESVRSAEDALTSALAVAATARDNLTAAEARAVRERQDLARSAERARLDEEGAGLSLEEAKKRLADLLKRPHTDLELREAQHAIREAQQAVQDAADARKRADEDAKRGTDTVKKARDALAEANKRVADAEVKLAKTRTDAAKANAAAEHDLAKARIDAAAATTAAEEDLRRTRAAAARERQDAERRVADATVSATKTTANARKALARAETDSARATARAQDAVALASTNAARATARAAEQLRASREAESHALDSQSAAASAADTALGKLSGTERRLLTTVKGTVDAFTKAFAPATDAIFGGVDRGLQKVTPLLGHFSGRFKGIGKDIGDVITHAASSLSGPEWTRAFDSFIKTAGKLVKPISNAVGSVINILRDIAVAAQPFVVDFAKWMEKALGGLANGTKDAKGLRDVIAGLVEHTKSWARLAGDVAKLIFVIFNSGAKDGKSLVDTLDQIVRRWTEFLGTKKGQEELRKFFADSIRITKDFAAALAAMTSVFYRFSRAASGTFDELLKTVKGAIDTIDGLLTLDFKKSFDGMKPIADTALRALIDVFKAWTAPFRATANKLWDLLPDGVKNALGKVRDAVSNALNSIAKTMTSAAGPMRAAFASMFRGFTGIASTAWSGVTGVVKKGMDFLLGGITTLDHAIEAVARVGSHLPLVGNQFKGLADAIKRGRGEIDKYRESLRKTDSQHGQTNRVINGTKSTLKDLGARYSWVKDLTDAGRAANRDAGREQGNLNAKFRDAKPASDRARDGVDRLRGGVDSARKAFDSAGRSIASGYNSLAGQFDLKQVTFRAAAGQPPPGQGGGPTRPAARGKISRADMGGWVGNPGEAGHDNELYLLGRGEAVLNRHQQAAINDLLAGYGTSVNDVIGSVRRPHYAATGKTTETWPARGAGNSLPFSMMTPIGGPRGGGESIFPRIAGQVRSLISKWRAYVLAGWAPTNTHAGSSDHHWGGAVDLEPGTGGTWDLIDKLAAWAEPAQNRPAHGFRWVGYNGDPNHGRNNHLHLSWPYGRLVDGVSGAGGDVAAPKITGPAGPMLELLRGSTKRLAEGAQAKINKALGSVRPVASTGPDLIPGAGRTVTASLFGGPTDASVKAPIGYRGDDLSKHPDSFAELSHPGTLDFAALGGLPYRSRLRVSGPTGSKILVKRDVGRGGPGLKPGAPRAIDLWYTAARQLGVNGLGLVKIQRAATGRPGSSRRPSLPSVRGKGTHLDLGAIGALQRDRIDDFESTVTTADGLRRRYETMDSENGRPIELVDAKTGTLNTAAVRKRVDSLRALAKVTTQIVNLLDRAHKIARRVVASYDTVTSRLRASLRYAGKRDRAGVRAQVGVYGQRRAEWSQRGHGLDNDLRAVRGDSSSISREVAALMGAGVKTAAGGKPGSSTRPPLPQGTGKGTMLSIQGIAPLSTDKVDSFDKLSAQVEDDRKRYEQLDRRYGQSTEELVDQQTGQVNTSAVARRVKELRDLEAVRKRIWQRLQELRQMARQIATNYLNLMNSLAASLKYAKAKDRDGIRKQIEAYRERRHEWLGKDHDLGFDTTDAELDFLDIHHEGDEIAATHAVPVTGDSGAGDIGGTDIPATDPGLDLPTDTPTTDPGTDLPTDTPTDPGTGTDTGGSTAPTAADIAAAVHEQLAAFDANRQDLFGNYGSNFVTAGMRAIYDPTTGAAGFRHFGAVPTGADITHATPGAAGARGGGDVTVIQHFEAPPNDPHTWSRGIEFELQTLGR